MSKKTKILLLVGILAVASIIYILVVARKTPAPSTSTPAPITSSVSEIANAKYQDVTVGPQLIAPSVPKEFPIYIAETQAISLVDTATLLANQFNLQAHRTRGVWLNNATGEFLSLSSDATQLVYNIDSYTKPELYSGPNRPQTELATQSVNSFIAFLPAIRDLGLEVSSVEHLKQDDEHLQSASEAAADIIKINYSQKINGIPLFVADQIRYPMSVWVGQQNKVVKVEVNSPIAQYRGTPTMSASVSYIEALDQVKQGAATVLDIQGEAALSMDLTKLTNLTLNSVTLEYRLNKSSRTLLPYYKFLAIISAQPENITVFLLVPASKN